MQRYLSIDILRGLAIILMIQVHFVDDLSSRELSSGWLYDASMLLGSLPAPFFTIVFGLSFGLWVRKQEFLGRQDREITIMSLRRGLFLFALGIVFNFCIWLPEDTFDWDILTLIGTSFLFLALARKLPAPVLVLICVIVILVSPMLRVVGGYPAYWKNGYYDYDFTFRDIIFGFTANGYFPVFPWIIFPIMGFVGGDLIFQKRTSSQSRFWYLGVVGISLLALSGISVASGTTLPASIARHHADRPTEFPATTSYILAMLGFATLALVLLNRWVDQNEKIKGDGPFLVFLRRYSYFSLSVYVLHHMVILWPLWIYGVWTGHRDEPTFFWRNALSTPMAFTLAIVFIIACYFVLLLLENNKKYSLESFMRWVCEYRVVPGPNRFPAPLEKAIDQSS
jgi:uncharacterized membrane protein